MKLIVDAVESPDPLEDWCIVIQDFQFKVELNKSGGDVMYDINLEIPLLKETILDTKEQIRHTRSFELYPCSFET